MIASLKTETGIASDRDYVEGQVRYQKGNAALFQYEILSSRRRPGILSARNTFRRSKTTSSEL